MPDTRPPRIIFWPLTDTGRVIDRDAFTRFALKRPGVLDWFQGPLTSPDKPVELEHA